MANKTLIGKLATLLDTTTVMLAVSTRTRWNALADRERRSVLRILLAVVERTGRKRLLDMDYQNAMNQAEGC